MLVKLKALAVFVATDQLNFRIRDSLGGQKREHLVTQQMWMNSTLQLCLVSIVSNYLLNAPSSIRLLEP